MRGPEVLAFPSGWMPGSGLALRVAGCAAVPPAQDGLTFRAPQATGTDTISTSRTPGDVVQALKAAGFESTPLLRDGSIRVRSAAPALVDCGPLLQVALGNRVEVSGTAPKAVLIAKPPLNGPTERKVKSSSDIRLVPLASGKGYAVAETHSVTVTYRSVSTGRVATSRISFDETGSGRLADHTSCKSSGLIHKILR